MKQIEKLKTLSKSVLTNKDYGLVVKFVEKHDFDSFSGLIDSEITKESKLCEPEKMTERYCILQDIKFNLVKYDLNNYFEEKCVNYEEE